MKYSEIQLRAKTIIDPLQRELQNNFQAALTETGFERGVSEWQRDRSLDKLTVRYVREHIELARQVLEEVVGSSKSMVAEHEFRELFGILCPTLDDLKSYIFPRFVGYNFSVSASLAGNIENAYRTGTAVAIEKLALQAYDVSTPGQFKGRRIVFISCGQCTEEEVTLGSQIKDLIQRNTEYEGYFAQNEQSLEGVTTNILGALGACVGFVGVMHHRGDICTTSGALCRGSVWIEQEIALVTYRVQTLGHSLAVATYVQEGIALEGLRQFVLLNPFRFKTGDEVLHDLTQRFEQGTFFPRR